MSSLLPKRHPEFPPFDDQGLGPFLLSSDPGLPSNRGRKREGKRAGRGVWEWLASIILSTLATLYHPELSHISILTPGEAVTISWYPQENIPRVAFTTETLTLDHPLFAILGFFCLSHPPSSTDRTATVGLERWLRWENGTANRCKNLSLDPQHPRKKSGIVEGTHSPRATMAETGAP